MQESQVNKIDLIHSSSISNNIKIYYVIDNIFYELKLRIDDMDYHPQNLFRDNPKGIFSIIEENMGKSVVISLDELLNNEDRIMTSTMLFKERVRPYIRNQKIDIINGN